MNRLTDDQWRLINPELKRRFGQLTDEDLAECGNQIDLLIRKLQSRQWVGELIARREVHDVLAKAGLIVRGSAPEPAADRAFTRSR